MHKERAAAGMAPQTDPADPPRWTTYFATDDADATTARVSAAGGAVVVEPMDVGPMAIALDPQGHPFGLWQAGQATGVAIFNEPGALVWNDAAVDDPAAARDFYGSVFDFRFDELEGQDGYTTFATGEAPLGGLSGHQPGVPKGWASCFAVGSTDATVTAAEKTGGQVVVAAQDTPFGRFAVLEDPWGAAFSVMQLPAG